MGKHYRKENNCLNCGTILEGHFCHNCGQENLEIHESFGHMMNHAVSDYFHFDHQFFHTLKPLLFKPGFLTNEYMAGRRVKYLHPVKMYIFISVVYFLVAFNLTRQNNQLIRVNESPTPTKASIEKEERRINADKTIDAQTKQGLVYQLKENDTSYTQYLDGQKRLPEKMRDGFWSNLYNKRIYAYKEKYGKNALEQFVEGVRHNIPKMMFILLPLFALQLRLTFRKNKKFYVEHLIFAFHYFCFTFLFLSIITLLVWLVPSKWTPVIFFVNFVESVVIMLYFYKALRAVYHRGRFRTVTKMIGVSIVSFAISIVCLMCVIIITGLISG